MGTWHKTGCVLCAQNCGLEVLVEDNRIVRSRPDKDNPRSQGYSCRKGLNVAWHQHHAQRLKTPLRRVGGRFEEVSWETALNEIAEKLGPIVQAHGPRSLAYMGGGGQGCHFEAAFGVRFLRGLGSKYHYSPLAQELTGEFWVQGRALGKQYMFAIPDEKETELLLAWGWNPWMSHQMPQARRVVDHLSKDPGKLLVVVDPRKTETAGRADLHLAVRPGTDALLVRAMIAIILEEGWEDREYLREHVDGFDRIEPWFRGFDARAAAEVCGLEYEKVHELCRLLATRTWCMHPDLGVLMSRHSTVTSYLHVILLAVCGRIGVRGGNVIPGTIMAMGSHSDERKESTWRTMATDFPAIMGTFPPNVMPEEIMSAGSDRLRAVIVSQSNPLRSYADTTAYEEAFSRLDLLVCIELAMTETARMAHYVLPARSGYESWDGTFFPWTFPEVFFQMRRPVVEPEGDPMEAAWIFTGLAERLGLVPEIPDSLVEAAEKDRASFGLALMEYAGREPKALPNMPFVLARTLGKKLGSANLAALWGLLVTAPKSFQQDAARAGFTPGPFMGDEIFQALIDHPEGVIVGRTDPEANLERVKTESGQVEVFIPELEDWLTGITPEAEEEGLKLPEEFPLILNAGRHMDFNANTMMRNPDWNKGKRACTAALSPADAETLGLTDGQTVWVVTEAGRGTVELEVDGTVKPGTVLIPHGFGLDYEGQAYGINVNRLTKNTHRDRLAATPLHRFVPCRIEAA